MVHEASSRDSRTFDNIPLDTADATPSQAPAGPRKYEEKGLSRGALGAVGVALAALALSAALLAGGAVYYCGLPVAATAVLAGVVTPLGMNVSVAAPLVACLVVGAIGFLVVAGIVAALAGIEFRPTVREAQRCVKQLDFPSEIQLIATSSPVQVTVDGNEKTGTFRAAVLAPGDTLRGVDIQIKWKQHPSSRSYDFVSMRVSHYGDFVGTPEITKEHLTSGKAIDRCFGQQRFLAGANLPIN